MFYSYQKFATATAGDCGLIIGPLRVISYLKNLTVMNIKRYEGIFRMSNDFSFGNN